MAGSRSYYSNVLTTTRGEVDVAIKLQVNGALGTAGTRILAGRGCSIVSVTSTGGGTNNTVTVQFPEKFGTCVNLDCAGVLTSATDNKYCEILTDYSATTGQATFTVLVPTGAAGVVAGATSPNMTVYVYGTFELGM